MLVHEVKVVKLEPQPDDSSVLKSYRSTEANALTLANKKLHDLYESIVDTYTFYELNLKGYDLDAAVLKWEAAGLPFSKIHYLRLRLDYTPDEDIRRSYTHEYYSIPPAVIKAKIHAHLDCITKLLKSKFNNLKDLQLTVLIDYCRLQDSPSAEPGTTPCWELKRYLVHNHAEVLGCSVSKLVAVQVKLALIGGSSLHGYLESTKYRTGRGWRHDMKQYKVVTDSTEIEQVAQEIGLAVR